MLIFSEIKKDVLKIAKLKDGEPIAEWVTPCLNHLHWSAVTTPSGDGDVIWAKFKSFLWHVRDIHCDFDNPLFNKCHHREIIPIRTWLEEGKLQSDQIC